ncbi:hypothetical protein VTK56DRAFT_6415 [Thermocarpiscus australiensis]
MLISNWTMAASLNFKATDVFYRHVRNLVFDTTDNVEYTNVPTVPQGANGQPLLLGDLNGTVYNGGYARGNIYAPRSPSLLEGREFAFSQPATLKLGNCYYERSKPQDEGRR